MPQESAEQIADVRQLLETVWMGQACQCRPEDRPRVLATLLKPGAASPGGSGFSRGSWEPRVAAASLALTVARAAGHSAAALAPIIWRAFPALDAGSRVRLAELLAGGAP
jgi:hypothetical protein